MTLSTIFLAVAFICFLLGAFGVRTGKISIMSLGLAFWVLASLIGVAHIGSVR